MKKVNFKELPHNIFNESEKKLSIGSISTLGFINAEKIESIKLNLLNKIKKKMGKKFITVQSRKSNLRLFDTDIKKIFYCKMKKIPIIPQYDYDNIEKLDETTPDIFLEEKA